MLLCVFMSRYKHGLASSITLVTYQSSYYSFCSKRPLAYHNAVCNTSPISFCWCGGSCPPTLFGRIELPSPPAPYLTIPQSRPYPVVPGYVRPPSSSCDPGLHAFIPISPHSLSPPVASYIPGCHAAMSVLSMAAHGFASVSRPDP